MDLILDCDTLDCIGQALRDAYQTDIEHEIPTELVRLCAELEQASCLPATGGRH